MKTSLLPIAALTVLLWGCGTPPEQAAAEPEEQHDTAEEHFHSRSEER